MAGEDFTIETKLKIAGVVATGNLDAGTLKFKVDTSALKKLVKDAARAAESVKSKFDNIKLSKIKLEINQSSLRQIESQIRGAIKNAVGKAKVVIDTSLGKGLQGDPFKAQRNAADKASESLKTMHQLTKDVNQGLRSLATTLGKFGGMVPGGQGGVIQANAPGAGLPLPPGAKVVDLASIQQQVKANQRLGDFTELLNQKQRDGIKISQQQEAQFSKVEKARLRRIQQLTSEIESLARKEQQLTGGGAFGAGPPGGGGGGGGFGGGGGGLGFGGAAGGAGGGGGGASSIQALAKAMEQVEKSTQRAGEEMNELERIAFEVGRKAATFRGVAIAINTVVNATQAAVKFVIQYNDSLLELNKVLQADAQVLQLIGDQLFALAKTSGFAVDQTIAIATEFARAGLEGRGYGNIVELTSKALLGIQGTSLDAAQATEIIIQTIQQLEGGARGLGKELISTTKLFDILGKAEDITASKASDVQDAFKRSLASLSATGASMEELVAIVSVLQERTQRGGDVIGTALKTLASRIGSSSSEASVALRSIGVATVDSEGKLRNIFDVLRDTSKAFEGLSEVEQANISVKAAGIRQVEIFRAALLDFDRVQEVATAGALAQGDAQRKQALEQAKLSNTIIRIQSSLQQLVKTASEGSLGAIFTGAIHAADQALRFISELDAAAGGFISTFAGGAILIGGFKALIPIVKGIFKAFQLFVSSTHEANKNIISFGTGANGVAMTVNSKMNPALATTAATMVKLNQEMAAFNQAQELAATRAMKFQKAQQQAVMELSARGRAPTSDEVNTRTQRIMSVANERQTRARSEAITSMVHQGGSKNLVTAAKTAPDQFSEAERRRILSLEKVTEAARSKITAGFTAVGKTFTTLANHPILTSIGFSALAGGLDILADKTGSTAAKVGASAAQFAGLGAMFGPWGIAIGALGGALGSFIVQMNKGTDTIDALTQKYVQLGLIQTENGEVGVEAAKKIDKAFKNIQALRGLSLTMARTENSRRDAAAGKQPTIPPDFTDVFQEATRALKELTGATIDLSDETLGQVGSGANLLTSSTALEKIIEAYEAIAPDKESMAELQEAVDKIFTETAESMPIEQLMAERGKVSEKADHFLSVINETLDNAAIGVDSSFEDALQSMAGGDFSEGVQKAIEEALQLAAGGAGPQTRQGTTLSSADVERFVAAARDLGTRSNELNQVGGPSRQARVLARVQQEAPDIIGRGQQRVSAESAAESKQARLETQLRAFSSISSEMMLGAVQIGKSLGRPVDKLQLSMREFIAGFSAEIMKLKEVTVTATTPQEELAGAMKKLAQEGLTAAESRRGLEGTDARLAFEDAINKLVAAPERMIDETGKPLGEQDTRMVIDAVREMTTGLNLAIEKIRTEQITDPRKQREVLEGSLPKSNLSNVFGDELLKGALEEAQKFSTKMIELDVDFYGERAKLNSASLEELKQSLSKQNKELSINRQRREIIAQNASAILEELTGMRQLVTARELESQQASINIAETRERVMALNKAMEAERAAIAVNDKNVDAVNKLAVLRDEQTREAVALEEMLAKERIANIKQSLAAAQEAIAVGNREADFQKTLIAGRGELVDLLAVGERQIDQFNRKLDQNSETFRVTQATLASEMAIVNATVQDGAEKEARLADIRKRGAVAAIDAAKAEAQIIAERRAAVQQLVQEGLANQDEQVSAQKAVLDATEALSEAFLSYREAVQGSILATTQYRLGIRLAQVETVKLTGGFSGIKEELSAVTEAFRSSEKLAREMGASEKTLVDIRRQSIDAQLSLFNQLLSQQSGLARQFFQSSAEDQASLFQGIQQAKGVADMLGGSFANFQKMGEGAINDLGAQLLALPQESRQQVVRSLETLSQVGGATVGGFTPDQLLTAIETASLGVSEEGLDVDPLFEVQKRIADLSEQQARLATEQLIASQDSVEQAKQQLEEAQASKDLAEIQLERIKEEGAQIRSKLGELNADLRTVLLQQDTNAKNGFNMVTGIIARSNDILTNTLPDALSVKIAQAFREALTSGNLSIPGLTGPRAESFSTPTDRGTEMAQNIRQDGSNRALQQQIASQAGSAPAIMGDAFGGKQGKDSNLPDSSGAGETNKNLADILSELKNINTLTTTNNEVLTEIRDTAGNTVGTASATIASPAAAPEITVTINGEQRVTVTGFEAGVTRIATALSDTFGGFATENEAREIANSVVEAIRLELERLGILNRNQL